MTAQIGDIYNYDNNDYRIVALSSVMLFKPQDYGMEPHGSCTACWRGYWCEYDVSNDELFLKNLYFHNEDNNYPSLNGVEASPKEFIEVEGRRGLRKKLEKFTIPAHYGHRVYRDVNLSIPYTGKILLGDGFIREYYIHMGFQRAWAYEKLIELVFEEGILLECNDYSHIAKQQREIMKEQGVNPQSPKISDLEKFVEDSFSLDYSDKAWWLE